MTEALIGDQSIADDLKNYGMHSPYTQLNPGPFKGANPDSAEGEIPYEKGFQFLYHVEHTIGAYHYQNFLKYYFPHNIEKSLWDFEMLAQLKEFLVSTFGSDQADEYWTTIDPPAWIYSTGNLPQKQNFETQDSRDAIDVSNELLSAGKFSAKSLDMWANFYTNQRVICLDNLINHPENVTEDMVNNIWSQLKIAEEMNLEITSRTTIIGLNAKMEAYVARADTILSEMGRLLYLQPLFRALKNNGYATQMHQIYEKNASFYSPIARNTLRSIIDTPALYEGDVMADHWANHKFFTSRL
jgi:leukotriene-A4 hydrolase